MFESAELGHRVGRREYERELPGLRSALLDAQMKILERADFPVILLCGGVDGAGKGDVVNKLLEWMDPHDIRVHAMGAPIGDEALRPPMWRFWRALPAKGKAAVFFGSWYTAPIVDRVYRRIRGAELATRLAEIARFERMLVDEGVLLVKLWLYLTEKAQRARLKGLEKSPATAWRVTREDWKNHARYDRFRKVSEHALRETSTAEAPWTVVDASDPRFRDLTVGRTLLDAMTGRLRRGRRMALVRAAPPSAPSLDARNVLADLDLSRTLTERQYAKRLPVLQGRLNALSRAPAFRDFAVMAVFEGNDAAGKGGAIQRVTRALDARRYEVVPVGPPTEEERAQPYLWRFWRHVPRRGEFALFDRSWYGRVLVERVEGFAAVPDWMRAYREIVDFEESLVQSRVVVVKLWLSVGKTEQLSRFRARERTPYKRFKITPDDWRNRKKWDLYERAACDMVDRTSTDLSRWHLVEANDKKWARVRVLEILCDAVEKAIKV